MEGLLDGARASSLYRTRPQMDVKQDDFWNAVVVGSWLGTPEGLLERLLMLEAALGRQRDPSRPKGPRVIDLDLIDAGAGRASARLTLPHPGWRDRRFVLDPLVELDPEGRASDGFPWSAAQAALPPQGVDRSDLPW